MAEPHRAFSTSLKGPAMNKSEIAVAPNAFTSKEDVVKSSPKDAGPLFENLTDDQLLWVGGGDGVVCW